MQRLARSVLVSALTAALSMAMPAKAETLEQRAALLAPHFGVSLPPGPGRFPVAVMLHGCGGPRPFMLDMARAAVEAGAAALIVDSYAPRRISRAAAFATICTGARLQGRERAGDLYAALTWARRQSWADPERLAVIGWSHGGWTILDALALQSGAEMQRATRLSGLPSEPMRGVAAALIVYPYAGIASLAGRRPWRIAPQSTAIVAGRDYIVGAAPVAALERQRLRGAPLHVVRFDEATHAFEDAHAEDPRVRFNPAATAREREMLQAMLAELRRPS